MQRFTAFGTAVALALGATAAYGHSWYGNYRGESYVSTAPIEVTRVERVVPSETVVYTERYVEPAPEVVVQRDYSYVAPRETVLVQADPIYTSAFYDPRHPDWGHLIDYNLFKRDYPNHFGR